MPATLAGSCGTFFPFGQLGGYAGGVDPNRKDAVTHTLTHLERLEADLASLLASWLDVGFLVLREIDWNSPASTL